MRVDEIEKLLADFYEGNTSENQEEIIRKYFETQKVPAHLEPEKRLFLGMHTPSTVNVPQELSGRISRMIDTKEMEEMHFFRKNRTKLNWHWIGGIAASILLLIGIGISLSLIHDDDADLPKDTFTDPQMAYEVLQATLMEVSTGLNKGIDQVVESQKEISKINNEIKKDLQP